MVVPLTDASLKEKFGLICGNPILRWLVNLSQVAQWTCENSSLLYRFAAPYFFQRAWIGGCSRITIAIFQSDFCKIDTTGVPRE